jgi:chromosome segregation ATPase
VTLKECHANQDKIIHAQEKLERQLRDQEEELEQKRQRVADLMHEAEVKAQAHSTVKRALEQRLSGVVSETEVTANKLCAAEEKLANTTTECADVLAELSELRQAHAELSTFLGKNKKEIERLSEIDRRQLGAFGTLEREHAQMQERLEEERAQLGQCKHELETSSAHETNLQTQLENNRRRCVDVEDALGKLRAEYFEAEGALNKLRGEHSSLRGENSSLHEEYLTLREEHSCLRLDHNAKMIETDGFAARWADEKQRLDSHVKTLESTNTNLQKESSALLQTKLELEASNDALGASKAELQASNDKLEASNNALESSKVELEATVKSVESRLLQLQQDIASKSTEVTGLKRSMDGTVEQLQLQLVQLQSEHSLVVDQLQSEHEGVVEQLQLQLEHSMVVESDHEEVVDQLKSERVLLRSKYDLLQNLLSKKESEVAAKQREVESQVQCAEEEAKAAALAQGRFAETQRGLEEQVDQREGELCNCKAMLAAKDQELDRIRAVQQQLHLGMEEVEKRHEEREHEMQLLSADRRELSTECTRLQCREKELQIQLLSAAKSESSVQETAKECERLRCEVEVATARLECEVASAVAQSKAHTDAVEEVTAELQEARRELAQSGDVLDSTQRLVSKQEAEALEQAEVIRRSEDARRELGLSLTDMQGRLHLVEQEKDAQEQVCAAAEGQLQQCRIEMKQNEGQLQVHADGWGDEISRREEELKQCKQELKQCLARREEDGARLIEARVQLAKTESERERVATESLAHARAAESLDVELADLKGKLAEAVQASRPPLTPPPALAPDSGFRCSQSSEASADDSVTLLEKLGSHSIVSGGFARCVGVVLLT